MVKTKREILTEMVFDSCLCILKDRELYLLYALAE